MSVAASRHVGVGGIGRRVREGGGAGGREKRRYLGARREGIQMDRFILPSWIIISTQTSYQRLAGIIRGLNVAEILTDRLAQVDPGG